MSYFLAKILFPKTIKQLEKEKKDERLRYLDLQSEKINLKSSKLEYNKLLDLISDLSDNEVIWCMKKDKTGRVCIVKIDTKNTFTQKADLYRYCPKEKLFINSAHIYFSIRLINIELKIRKMKLDDIQVAEINTSQGLGSIIVRSVLQYAKNQQCKYVEGELGYMDYKDHKNRLLHFYKKHGFLIRDTENFNETPKIYKELYSN